ncbi:MAG: aminotransferase class I/II-fold pyridoxal phosphate-dependent enzyme [Acidobacteriia bacterium]|nr:aminotransferase class I/II-fold pyridoxal phosphate-dependent enzyme [Terriglobia bacterium]
MSRLEVPPEQFWRVAGYILGLAKDFLGELDTLPTFPPGVTGLEVQQAFAAPLPQEGEKEDALADLMAVLQWSRPPSPRFFGYVLGSGDPIAACADLLAGVMNQNVTAWRSAPAAVAIERVVVGWLAEAVGCAGFTGSLTGGGSSANTMGLAMAREAKSPANEDGARPAIVYASDQVHMSIPKAVALLGLGRKNLRLIPTDENFRMVPAELEKEIAADTRAGKKAIAVVASAGSVNTGAIDPLPEIADICRRHNLWLHVDGAYGALAAIAAPEKFRGLVRADSLSLDPHKWLYQPLDCGCLLFRDPQHAHTAFAHSGDYARVLSQDPIEGFAFFEESLELSRRFRALKVWLSLRYHGLNAFREAIRADLAHAQQLAELVRANDKLELLAPVELSAVCFRHLRPGASDAQLDDMNAAILKQVIRRGRVYISNASIREKFALRACFVNHRTSDEDVRAVVEEVLATAAGA